MEREFDELLIDGDLLVFSSCAAIEYGKDPEEVDFAKITNNIEGRIMNMKNRLNAKKIRIFFSDRGNFRYKVLPEYKANRKNSWLPESLDRAKNHITVLYNGEKEDGLEADDLVAKYQKQDGSTVIATIDKDIPQVRGWHYRWETQHRGEQLFEVSGMGELNMIEKTLPSGKKKAKIEGNGIRFFCWQLLVGDPTDGIMGCGKLEENVYKTGKKAGETYTKRKGLGPVNAYKALDHALDYNKMMAVVIQQYKECFGDEWEDALLKYGRCLFMVNKTSEDGRYLQLWHYKTSEIKNSWFDTQTGLVGRMEG